MEEKVLKKGEFFGVNILSIVFFALAVLTFIACLVVASIFHADIFIDMSYGYYWFFIAIIIFVVIGILLLKVKPELTITDKYIIGKGVFKKVALPVKQITAVGTGIFKSISITTAKGIVSFCFVSNNEEIFTTIYNLLKD